MDKDEQRYRGVKAETGVGALLQTGEPDDGAAADGVRLLDYLRNAVSPEGVLVHIIKLINEARAKTAVYAQAGGLAAQRQTEQSSSCAKAARTTHRPQVIAQICETTRLLDKIRPLNP